MQSLTSIDAGTWLVLGALGLAVLLILVVLLRRPAPAGAADPAALDAMRAERDDWREAAETRAAELATTRERLARLESVTEERDRLRTDYKALTEAHNDLARRHEGLKSAHEAAQENHAARLAEMKEVRERFEEQFKLTASELLKTSGEELNRKGSDTLGNLLKPLREQLGDFQKRVIDDAEKRMGQTAEIRTVMEKLHSDARQMSDDAKRLTNALRSNAKSQGNWGELILKNILEGAGLREGFEFETQDSVATEDGRRLQPDIVVRMPNKQNLVIDSKVSIRAFETAVDPEAEEHERNLATRSHVDALRNHIKTLGMKDYSALYESVDFVLMFVPLEGAVSLAFQSDGDLSTFAWENNVIIATPTTLMMAMRTVENLWTVDRQNRNALEIADRAGKLYDKFHGFVSDLDEIGARLRQAEKAWDGAKRKLSSGPGNAIGQAEKLKKLGARARKSLPEEYLDAAGEDATNSVDEEDDDTAALPAPERADS